MHSHQATTLVVTTEAVLLAKYPPNKSGNFVGMKAQITEAAEDEFVEYSLMPTNEAEPIQGLRWVPCCEEPGPYFY